MSNVNRIEVTGVDLVELVKAAYSLSVPQGMGFMHYQEGELTDDEAKSLIDLDAKRPINMDYVKGRACKFTVTKDDGRLYISSSWYDHTDADLKELLNRVGLGDDTQESEEVPHSDIKLSADNVQNIFMDCLFKEGENHDEHVVGEGVMTKCGFHPERLDSYKGDIRALLEELPDEFRHDNESGGWSFLNACVTKDGDHWGEHQNVDQLVCLGNATGMLSFLMPRELWAGLPGGMPYFSVNTNLENVGA